MRLKNVCIWDWDQERNITLLNTLTKLLTEADGNLHTIEESRKILLACKCVD